MPVKIRKLLKGFHPGMSLKLTAAISSIVVILVLSSIISIYELMTMGTLVSDSVSENIQDISLSTELAMKTDEYNLAILSLVGEADFRADSNLDPRSLRASADSTLALFRSKHLQYAQELTNSFEDYLETSFQLDTVIRSDFTDSREWYFTSLQPTYNEFRKVQERFNAVIYNSLHENSTGYDESFYRGIMPGFVSVAAGIVLVLLLLFFILVYYVRPLRKMLKGIEGYKMYSKPYNYSFEGDDELCELNSDIIDIIDENHTLRKRIRER